MTQLIVGRLLRTVPVVVGVMLLIFGAMRLVPGDPAVIFAGERATATQVEAVRQHLGLDRSIPEQFGVFVGDALTGDLGTSIRSGEPVVDEIGQRYPKTLVLALAAISFSVAVGLPLGLLAAVRRGRWADKVSVAVALLGVSAPTFLVAALLQYGVAVELGWLPVTGDATWRHLVLPGIALGVFPVANIARLVRSGVSDALTTDFVRTARAKGVPEWRVVGKHALKPSLIPTVTVVGLQLGFMLAAAVFVEVVFAWPGLGRYLVDSIATRDYPAVQGVLLVLAISYVVINLLVDLSYRLLEPRIR